MSGFSTPQHSVSVAGVITNESGQILSIQRRDNSRWEPPGGVLELGETFAEGVAREVYEETGVHVRALKLTGAYKNMDLGIVALVYRCELLSGRPHPTPESRAVRWLTPAEVTALMAASFAERVLDALTNDVSSRTHDNASAIPEPAPAAAAELTS